MKNVCEREAPGAVGFICQLDYIDAHLDAARRLARGERQVYCVECERWVWVGECEHEGKVKGG